MKTLIVAAITVLLASCVAPAVRMTYVSYPEGAAVIENGRLLGVTPLAVEYHPTKQFYQGQCVPMLPLTARWISGASAEFNGVMCPRSGYNQQISFLRPSNVVGAQTDIQNEANQQLLRAQQAAIQAQADAQAEQNLETAAGAIGHFAGQAASGTFRTPQMPMPQYPPPPPKIQSQPTVQPFQDPSVTCTSTTLGNTVSTTCH